ncbi:MAG: restriction endonuclease subunit S [Patescibacteria group bacterium]|nr:restriction endonuclease subunit S [Patescibacteria group bacterium]
MKTKTIQKNNWQIKKLGKVCKLIKGKKPSKFVSKSSKPYLTAKVVRGTEIPEYASENCSSSVWVKKEDIIIIMDGSNSGEMFTGLKGALASTMGIVEYQEDLLNSKYLLHFLTTHRENFTRSRTGSAIPHLNKDEFENLEIPLPPLPEQKRIVKILDDTFEKIEKAKEITEKNLKNDKELFESYLQSVFENKGKDWEEKELGELGKASMCKRIFKDQTSTSGDIPFYKIGTFGKKPNAFISKELYNKYRNKYSSPKKGDVLISASGTIGRRVSYDGKPAYFQDSNIVWIDNNEKIVLNEYLYCFYGYCNWKPSKGATISRLYNSNLRQIKISFPKSLTTQKQIVVKLDKLSKHTKMMEGFHKKNLENLEELKKSLLKKAFNGEL